MPMTVSLASASRRLAVAALLLAGGLAPFAAPGAPRTAAQPLPVTDPATDAALDRVLAGPQRPDASRDRDVYRHPKATLEFFGIRNDMTVLEVWPGKAGWWTEILGPLLRENGHYIAAQLDPTNAPAGVKDSLAAFRAKLDADQTSYAKVEVAALQYPGALTPAPANSVDLALTFRNLHNWLPTDGAARAMLGAIYTSLKPGGILGIEDHRARTDRPTEPQVKLGYVDEKAAIELIRSVGFEFVGSSEINANPKDTKDYEQGVWTLPPTYRLGDKDRDRYAAIGESDRFTLKFRKPLNAK